ncbi:hypothetical protein COCNU_06G020760 [Cocos nucifera]|uniref:Uncharacterized protein n=1 Tax=Cocos nucifera TaxID=13894 RepID=A0A8K0N4M3_COCNU|nr:hypothetical protein COCNU_06G020760 [Cocos nucifera]
MECDSCLEELEEKRKKLKASEAEVASVRVSLDRAKEQALEEFRGSEDFKEELLAASCLAYLTGYEDGRDAVDRVYPDLDLSCIPFPDFDGEEADEEDESVEVALITDASIMKAVLTKSMPTIEEPTPALRGTTSEALPFTKEMALAMAVIDAVVVDDLDH